MTAFVAPQLCRLVEQPPDGADWVHEAKFDGYRVQMHVERRKAKLLTRKGLDWTSRWPEIAREGSTLPSCVLDGEVCALDADGHTDFGLLQEAMSDGRTGNLLYFAFDCLAERGIDLRRRALADRKRHLQDLLKRKRLHRLRYVPHYAEAGKLTFDAACRSGLEGIVSKRLDAPYISGRTGDWTKSKCRGGQEVVIGGWSGSEAHLRSLLVGARQNGRLIYLGRVGTGFTDRVRADLLGRLKRIRSATSPFGETSAAIRGPDVHWVKPHLVAEIEFENLTSAGILRQAAFKGLRADKPAKTVTVEVPGSPKGTRR